MVLKENTLKKIRHPQVADKKENMKEIVLPFWNLCLQISYCDYSFQ